MILLAIIIVTIWLFETIWMLWQIHKAYREDVKRYGKEAARLIWKGRR